MSWLSTRLRGLPALKALVVLALLIAAMFAMLALKSQTSAHVSSAVTFAAIGFVVLAAYAMAEIATLVGLPRVTGYILAGIGLGPSMAALTGLDPPLLSTSVVADMHIFNDLALALIALEAGLELSLDALRRFKRTLAAIILFKIPLSWILLGGSFVLLTMTALPLPGVSDPRALLAIGLVLGALGVGTSPAVSIAVITEAGAKGKTADLILGFAVFKDVVMVVMLAVAIAVAQILLADGASFDGTIFLKLGKKILLSIGAGVVLGAALIAWLRWVAWENILMLLMVAYGVNYGVEWLEASTRPLLAGGVVAEGLKLKPLLVFIAAGFTVANFSRFGHALHKPLGLLALPVFVIFFTTAGAALKLEETLTVLPLALSLFMVRALVMYLSTRLGGGLAGEPRRYTNALWLGFISQAGVALVLLGIAVEELPEIGPQLHQIAFSLIALNLLIGPILLRVSLGRGAAVTEGPGAPPSGAGATPRRDFSELTVVAPVAPPDEPLLHGLYQELEARLTRLLGELKRDAIESWSSAARALLDRPTLTGALEPVPLAPIASKLRDHARALRDTLITLPASSYGRLSPEHLAHRLDLTLGARLAQRWLRLRYALGARTRKVGIRSLARARVEGRVIVAIADLLDDLALAEVHRVDALDRAQREARGSDLPPDALRATARAHIDTTLTELAAELDRIVQHTLAELAFALRFAGTPIAETRSVHFAAVATEVDRALHRLDERGDAWDQAIARVGRRGHLRAVLLNTEREVTRRSEAALARWERDECDVMLSVGRQAARALARTEAELAAIPRAALSAPTASQRVEELVARLDAEINEVLVPQITEMRLTAEERGPLKELEAAVAGLVPTLPATLELSPTSLDLSQIHAPRDIASETAPVAATIDKYLAGEMTWGVTETRAEDEELTSRVAQRLSEVAGAVTLGLRAGVAELSARQAGEEGLGERILEVAAGALRRASETIEELLEELTRALGRVPDNILRSNEDAFIRVYRRLLGEPCGGEEPPRGARREHLRRILHRLGRRTGERWGSLTAGALSGVRRVVHGERHPPSPLPVGAERVAPERMARDVRALETAPTQLDRLPYVLARLFAPSTLDTHHLLTGVDTSVSAIGAAHRAFCARHPTAVLVRGHRGSGKTSLSRVALRGLVGRRLVDVTLTAGQRSEAALCEAIGAHAGAFAARGFGALSRALLGADQASLQSAAADITGLGPRHFARGQGRQASGAEGVLGYVEAPRAQVDAEIARSDLSPLLDSRRVILLDGLEQLFVRTAEGVALIRQLLGVIAATRGEVMWIVSVDEPTALLLDPLCALSEYFTHHLTLPPKDAAQLGQLIEARSRLSGYDIVWPRGGGARGSLWRHLSREPTAHELRARFLADLALASEGNTRDALRLFVNAIDQVVGEEIHLSPITAPTLGWFDQLGRDAQRLLAALVLSGSLSPAEAKDALLWPADRLEAARSRLLGAELIAQVTRDRERDHIVPHACRLVTTALTARNQLPGGR